MTKNGRYAAHTVRFSWDALFQHGVQVPGDGAVLQDEAGDADATALADVGVDGAVLPQGQVDLQVGQTGGQVLEVDLRLCFAEAVQGVQGIRAQMAADDGDFYGKKLLCVWIG